MRVSMRRFTRSTNAFSKKVENHMWAPCASLHALQLLPDSQKFARDTHDGSGISDDVWSLEEIEGLREEFGRTSLSCYASGLTEGAYLPRYAFNSRIYLSLSRTALPFAETVLMLEDVFLR